MNWSIVLLLIGLLVILLKIIRGLSPHGGLANELDFTNPSLVGLIGFLCLVASPFFRKDREQLKMNLEKQGYKVKRYPFRGQKIEVTFPNGGRRSFESNLNFVPWARGVLEQSKTGQPMEGARTPGSAA